MEFNSFLKNKQIVSETAVPLGLLLCPAAAVATTTTFQYILLRFLSKMTAASLWVCSEPFEIGIVPVPPPSKLDHRVSIPCLAY